MLPFVLQNFNITAMMMNLKNIYVLARLHHLLTVLIHLHAVLSYSTRVEIHKENDNNRGKPTNIATLVDGIGQLKAVPPGTSLKGKSRFLQGP